MERRRRWLLEAESGFDLAGGVGGFAFVDGAGFEKVEVVVTDAFAVKECGTASRWARLPDLLEDAGLLFGIAFTVHFSSYGKVCQKFLPAGREKRRGAPGAGKPASPEGRGGTPAEPRLGIGAGGVATTGRELRSLWGGVGENSLSFVADFWGGWLGA